MKNQVPRDIDFAKWCDAAIAKWCDDATNKVLHATLNGMTALRKIEAIRSEYIDERQMLEQRITELERDKGELEYALKTYESAVDLKDKRIDELYARITERKILERLLADSVRFIAYAQSKGVHGGEAIAKEIEENLNQGEL